MSNYWRKPYQKIRDTPVVPRVIIVTGNKPLVSDEFTALSQDHSTCMSARLIARDVWVFQVLVVGADAEMDQEAVEMFLGSFRMTDL